MQMAIDAAGNAYLAVSYGSPLVGNSTASDPHPAIDLGVASPADQMGVAIVKVDTACNIVWLRELGAATFSSAGSIGAVAIAVDGDSNVAVLGSFSGAVDLGARVVDAAPVLDDAGGGYGIYESFLVRLDAGGGVAFSKVLSASGGWLFGGSVVASPGGVWTLLASGSSGADFGDGPLEGGTPSLANNYFVQLDSTGSVVREEELPTGRPSYSQLLTDPAGNLWADGFAGGDAGSAATLTRLTATGDVAWPEPVLPNASLFAVYGGGEGGLRPERQPRERDRRDVFGRRGPASTQTTFVNYLGPVFAQQMVADTHGDAIVGGTFEGTQEVHADGSFTNTASPFGVGFQRFDATGNLRSVGVWGDVNSELCAIGVDPNSGQVILLGSTLGHWPSSANVFVVRLAP
jgi:hypothetical protein